MEHLVECETVCRRGTEEKRDDVLVEVDLFDFALKGQTLTYHVPKDGSASVYVMNNDGRTVESYTWN